ncbi:hypothetical protein [Amycolatopsis sp. WAC 01375]|uniref:hypothetical protein n=1 Tax=Amycolatopsis sp. WAC 01375 TaxID=2203194 RepID=UPI0018F718E3|nr:hypothetical protein [Amycolatopsis sp. WAC 01375]
MLARDGSRKHRHFCRTVSRKLTLNATLTEAGYETVVEAAPGHVAAVREYLMDELEPHELAALRRIGTAVDTAIKRGQLDRDSTVSSPYETSPSESAH